MNMNENNQNSQKNYEVKKVLQEEQNIFHLETANGMVTIKGIGIEDSLNESRYKKIYKLLSKMESKLNERIEQDIKLSYIGLEALVKVFSEIRDDDEAVEYFTENISPRNFFYMLDDIDSQRLVYGPDKIYKKFFSTASDLVALDNFYNDFADCIYNSYIHDIPCIYAFIRNRDSLKNNNQYLSNIINALNGKDKKEKQIAFHVINEYYDESTKNYLSESSKEELSSKMEKINDNWKIINKITQSNKYYDLDGLYDLAV